MRRFFFFVIPLFAAFFSTLAFVAPAHAAAYGVDDGGNFFSADARSKAESIIGDIREKDHRDVLVITFDTIPADMQGEFDAKGKQRFFADWAESIGKERAVGGLVILLTRNPAHLDTALGKETRAHSFTNDDRDQLNAKMLGLLRDKQYDDALVQGVQFVKDQMRPEGAAAPAESPAQSTSNAPYYPSGTGGSSSHSTGFSVGGLVCVGVAILLAVFAIMGMVNRNRTYGGGGSYGAPPQGGYPPNYSGGYPQGGGYGVGGGGGGFGRGLLGGLLGGALGSWGYDRFMRNDNTPNYNPSTGGGSASGGDFGNSSNQGGDSSFSSTGGDFGSGGGDSSSSSGGDFGSSAGGGGDFGSSGGDFGGGGGGGDSSGGGSGGDF